MRYFIIFCIILLIFTNLKSLLRLKKSCIFLKKEYNSDENNNKKVIVLIPAMNEVNNVEKSINYFKRLKDVCNVIYITTSKERDKATYKKLCEEILKQKTSNIKVMNCPNTEGTMANQLNYVIKKLKSKDIISSYNIDSKPEKRTFNYVLRYIQDNTVMQQVSYFDDHLVGIMKSAQNWQNRWSIVYEMGKYLNNIKIEFKYCIGHGLFIKKELFDKCGYFSENDINEDNEFGYRLNINNIDIKPIPFLEKADFAKNKKIYIKQQSTWVNGPLYAFKYYSENKKSLKNLVLSILNFKAFLSWWLFPIFCFFTLFSTLMYDFYLFLILLLLVIFYISGINFLVSRLLFKKRYIKKNNNISIINDLLFFAMHSFGSYITLYKLIIGKNNIKNKYNTEK